MSGLEPSSSDAATVRPRFLDARGGRIKIQPEDVRGRFMQLFCSLEVDLDSLRSRFPGTLQNLRDEERDLGGLERDGLVSRKGARIRITPRGQLLLRTVAAPFDTYHRADARLHAPAL